MSGACGGQFCDSSEGEHEHPCRLCGHALADHAHGRRRAFWFCEHPDCRESCDHYEPEDDE